MCLLLGTKASDDDDAEFFDPQDPQELNQIEQRQATLVFIG